MNGPSLIPTNPIVHELPPQRPSRVPYLIGGLAVLVVGAGVSFFGFIFKPTAYPMQEWIALRLVSEEIQHTTFLADSSEGTARAFMNNHAFNAQSIGDTLISLDGRTTHAEIVLRPTGSYDIVVDGKQVLGSRTPKAGVSRSVDGTYVAFAHASTTATSTAQTTVDPATWSVSLLDVRTGAVRDIGTGVSPLFVDASHLVRITAQGIVKYDLSNGTDSFMVQEPFGAASNTSLSSPDRSLLAWRDSTRNTITVYRVAEGTADSVATIPIAADVVAYAIGNTAVYTLRPAKTGMQVWQQSFGKGAHKVLTLPPSLKVTRMVTGSI